MTESMDSKMNETLKILIKHLKRLINVFRITRKLQAGEFDQGLR